MTKTSSVDQAFDLFQNKKYEQALKAFKEIMADADVDSSVKSRVSQFIVMSERQLGAGEESAESGLKDVFYYINHKDYATAEKVLNELDCSESHKMYLKAEILAEKKDVNGAAEMLKKAIAVDPENRGYALNSPLFNSMINEDAFAFLKEAKENAA